MIGNPQRDRRVERHEATKAEILEVAWEVARTEGLAGVSLRDVARRVGMQAPSLYSYFGSKNAIYDAMYAAGAQAFIDHQLPVPITGVPLADLKTHMRSFVEFCTRDSARYQLLFQRTIPGFEPSAESFAQSIRGRDLVGERLAAIGIDDPRALDLLTAIGTGITDQQISNDPGGDRWSRLVDEAMEMFYAHVTARRARSARSTVPSKKTTSSTKKTTTTKARARS
ncbi:MAG: TetR/AcrR family transcriptional regulator [Acidimicrobiales bacterium]